MSDNRRVTRRILAHIVTLLRRVEFWIFGDLPDPPGRHGSGTGAKRGELE
jgi:hypothetical protein